MQKLTKKEFLKQLCDEKDKIVHGELRKNIFHNTADIIGERPNGEKAYCQLLPRSNYYKSGDSFIVEFESGEKVIYKQA